MKIDYNARQAKLRAMQDVDAVLLVPGANMVYFTGLEYHLSERPIIALFTADGLSFITPELEVPKLNRRPDLEARAFSWTDRDGYGDAIRQMVNDLKLNGKTLGVDGMTMRVFEWMAFWKVGENIGVKDVGRDLLDIRAIKTRDEIEAMRKANQLSEAALDKLLAWVQPGMTEKAIAARLNEELSAAGSTGNAFEPLIQTGPNSALPHGFSGDRPLQRDEVLLIDYGGSWENYPADITRTFCLGKPSAELQKIYDTVKRANEAGIQAAGPGVPCGMVDKAARDVITQAGYGEYFIHRTGHGLGLSGHELPQMAADVVDLLKPGMVFTVEPGIYIPGVGGVRIEDNVAVTETGVDVLTSYPKTFVIER
jgi:Xaa-Pro dipeptidase